jgi:hypothetical protein
VIATTSNVSSRNAHSSVSAHVTSVHTANTRAKRLEAASHPRILTRTGESTQIMESVPRRSGSVWPSLPEIPSH